MWILDIPGLDFSTVCLPDDGDEEVKVELKIPVCFNYHFDHM